MSQPSSPNGKFLVELVQRFSNRQLFFVAWFALVGVFVVLMIDFYKKRTRRNFRSPGEGGARRVRVDARQLTVSGASKEVAKRPDNGPPAAKP